MIPREPPGAEQATPDIVGRLRGTAVWRDNGWVIKRDEDPALMREAADQIAALRYALRISRVALAELVDNPLDTKAQAHAASALAATEAGP